VDAVIGYGADADELERIAALLGHAAGVLDARRSTLNAHIHHAPWHGHEADRFRQSWDHQYSRSLVSAAAYLHSARATLTKNAAEQRAASSVDGAAGGSGRSGAAPRPWPFGGAAPSWKGIVSGADRAWKYAQYLNPMMAPMLLVSSAPAALKALHLQNIRIGDRDNHIVINSDGTVSVKVAAIKTEFTENVYDGSFKVQAVGLGLEKTKEGAYGILATPGVHIGPVQLQAGLDVTYDPKTGVWAPSGSYGVGIDGILATHGEIHQKINFATGDFDQQVAADYQVGGYTHGVTAHEHNGEFVSTTSTDSVSAGGVTLSQTHSQSLSPDGTYTDAVIKSESFSAAGSLDTTYFAVGTEAVTATHTDTTATSTTADGTRTETHTTSDSSSGGGGGW
jgi:hypothetical protein